MNVETRIADIVETADRIINTGLELRRDTIALRELVDEIDGRMTRLQRDICELTVGAYEKL